MIQKKIRSLIYAGLGLILCVLLCGGIGMTAQAAETKTYEGFTYTENGSGITIYGYTGDKTELVIPGEIDGKKVTDIGMNAFYKYSSLTSVTIPESVTSIGFAAFWGCSGLTSVIIPEGVTNIGVCAFLGCSGLTSVTIPESVTSIEGRAFSECSGLTSITIPAGVTRIEETAFEGCSGLTSIVVDKENKYYDSRNNCNAIIATESNTLVIGCKNTTIPASVTRLGEDAFANCSGLTSITIPQSVTSIGDYAFASCRRGLVIYCYKDSTAYEYAMDNSFDISVELIGETETPGDTSGDDKPTPTPTPEPMPEPTPTPTPEKPTVAPAKKGATLTVSSKKIKVKVTSSSKKNPTVTVTKITDKKAKKLTIPATVKVKGVTYKVTAVSDKAFKGNKKLTTVTIGSNVTKIGKEAFSGCKNLKKITVTAGKLKTISKNAFKGINKKATITVKGTKKAKTALKKQLKKKSIGYVKTWKIK